MTHNLPIRDEYLKKRKRQTLVRRGVVLLLLILNIGIVSYIAHRPELRISKVELSGGILVTEEEVESESLSFLDGSYFWIFPRDSSFLYAKKKLSEHLKDSFRRIDTIEMSLKDLNTLSVVVTERKAVAIWCDTLPDAESLPPPDAIVEDGSYRSQGFCYFMDQNSNIFASAPNFSGDAYFKYYGLITVSSDIGNPIGGYYIASSTKFTDISDFVTTVRKLGIGPQYIIAKSSDEFSLAISGGGEIYFDTKRPLSVVSENLKALLENPPLSKYKNNLPVEYIDLRFGNKLFYKLK